MSYQNNIGTRRRLLCCSALTAAFMVATPAIAQDAAEQSQSPQEDATSTGNDIVVTARRTAEKLSDVPVSVAALGSEELTERRIFSEIDLQAATPGLTVRQTNSSNQISFSLRGQSLDAFSFAAPAVLNYVNEFNAQAVSASAFYDLESIQVLKGPQGTLFGRNATGGAVLYATRKPEAGTGGYLRMSYGNFDNRLVEGAINFGSDTIAARIAGQYQKRDGFQNNLLLGTKNGSVDNFSIRPSLHIETGRFTNDTMFQYTFSGGVNAGLRAVNYYGRTGSSGATGDPLNNFVNGQPFNGSLNFGLPSATLYPDGIAPLLEGGANFAQFGFSGLPSFIDALDNFGFYDIFNNQTGEHRARQYTITNTTAFELSEAATLKNIIGFNRSRSRDLTDVDGTPFEPLNIGFGGGTGPGNPGNPNVGGPTAEGYTYLQQQFSNELQVSGTINSFNYIAGLYYFEGEDYQRLPLAFAPDYVAALGGNLGFFLREYEVKTQSKAIYAQGTYEVASDLNLTLGGRWTWETTDYRPIRRTNGFDVFQDDFNVSLGIGPESLDANKPSWTVSLDYKASPDLLLYAAHRGSWRTGGFNGTAATQLANGTFVANRFEPETTYDFEVGAKFNGFVGNAATTFNIAIYDQYINNVIRAIYLDVAAVSGNVDRARVSGVEANGTILAAEWLELGGTVAYTDARYTANTATVGNVVVEFGPYGDVPEWTASAFAKATHQLSDGSELSFRADVYTQSEFFFSNAAATILPGTDIDGYTTVDLRADWSNVLGSDVAISAFVKNLTDEEYNVGGFALGAVNAINAVLPGLPRMYGVELNLEF